LNICFPQNLENRSKSGILVNLQGFLFHEYLNITTKYLLKNFLLELRTTKYIIYCKIIAKQDGDYFA